MTVSPRSARLVLALLPSLALAAAACSNAPAGDAPPPGGSEPRWGDASSSLDAGRHGAHEDGMPGGDGSGAANDDSAPGGDVSTTANDDSAPGGDVSTTADGGGPEVASITMPTTSLLLPGKGTASKIAAVALDAAGDPVAAELTWTSDTAGVLDVAPDGTLTALVTSGSTRVRAATAGGKVVSEPVFVYVAVPAEGALLVSKEQVVTPPAPVTTTVTEIAGTQVDVTLKGIAPPSPGSVIMGSDDVKVLGKVVSAKQVGADVQVRFEIAPLESLFEELSVKASGPLALPKGPKVFWALDKEFKWGKLTCTVEGTLPKLTPLPGNHLDISPKLDHEVEFLITGGKLQKAVIIVKGRVNVDASHGYTLDAGAKASFGCKTPSVDVKVPLPGPVGALLAGEVPLALFFELEAELKAGSAKLEAAVKGYVDVQIGFTWTKAGGFDNASKVISELKPTLTGALPDAAEDARLVASFLGPGLDTGLGLTITLPWGDPPSFMLLEAQAGPKIGLDLATPLGQVLDEGYASSASVGLAWSVKTSDDVKKVLKTIAGALLPKWVPVDEEMLQWTKSGEIGLAKTSGGKIAFDGSPDETTGEVKGKVVLDGKAGWKIGSLELWSVKEVVIERFDAKKKELIEVATVKPTSLDQTTYTWSWTPAKGVEPYQTFAAFVRPSYLPALLEVDVRSNACSTIRLSTTDVVAAADDPADDIDADVKMKEAFTTLQALMNYHASKATYWANMAVVYAQQQNYSGYANAIQLSKLHGIYRDGLSNELIGWAKLSAAVKALKTGTTKLKGGPEVDDWEGPLDKMVGFVQGALMDTGEPAWTTTTWETAPKPALPHDFILTSKGGGQTVMLWKLVWKVIRATDEELALVMARKFDFVAVWAEKAQMTLWVDGKIWAQGDKKALVAAEAKQVWKLGSEHVFEVGMSCQVHDKSKFPSHKAWVPMQTKLVRFKLKVEEPSGAVAACADPAATAAP